MVNMFFNQHDLPSLQNKSKIWNECQESDANWQVAGEKP